MGFSKIREVVDEAYINGKCWYSSFRKVPALGSVAGDFIDFSMAPGNPRPNYYTGDELAAKVFTGTYGMYHGGAVSPATKHLHKISALGDSATLVPLTLILCDYLIFYPLIDMDSTDDQYLDNTVTLPRYIDGEGIRAFLVSTNPYLGGATFYINYTNSYGVSERVSPIITSNTSTYIGTLVHSGPVAGSQGSFIRLASGDRGIRSIQSITFLAPNGGLGALVLCKPLATMFVREANIWSEFDFITMKPSLPSIEDGAYLNFIGSVNGSAAGLVLTGNFEVIWN
jgi:hypothetical protein